MKGKEFYESLEAALDSVRAYNAMPDAKRAEDWLDVAIAWTRQALKDACVEKASLKKEVTA